MRQKLIFISVSFFLLLGFTAATGYSVELDQEANLNGVSYDYSVTSIPTYEGLSAIETSSLENQCSGLRTVTWDGDSGETESDIVYSSRGYVFLAPQECDISIDGEDYIEESTPSLSEGWNIISTGSGAMFDEAQGELSRCEIPQSNVHPDRKKLYEISSEGSSTVMQMTESLEFTRAYWVEVEEDCEITQNIGDSDDSIVNPPEEDDSGDDSDESDDTVDDSPSDCAEDEYYDHGFDTCLEDYDSGDDSDESDESQDSTDNVEREIGDHTFTLSPIPEQIDENSDVKATVSGKSMEDKRVRLELDGIAGFTPNDPERYRECTGSPCSITIESDRIEGTPAEARIQLREYDPINLWETDKEATWNIN